MQASTQPLLYYVADPLCAWSYGFAPVLDQLRQHYAGVVHWSFLAGGMAVGEHAKPMCDVAAHVRSSLDPLAERTGAVFGPAFYDSLLNDAAAVYDSTLPSAAMVYVKHRFPAVDWPAFMLALQRGFFMDGLAPSEPELYERAAQQFDLPVEGFFSGIASEGNLAETHKEFDFVRSLDVTGFPALVLQQADGSRHMVQQGYASYERVASLIDRLLALRLSLD